MILYIMSRGFTMEQVLRQTLKQTIALFEYLLEKERTDQKIFTQLTFLANIGAWSKEGFEKLKSFIEETDEETTEQEIL